ncbi:hypothetical protein SAMN02745664_1203 [Moraxella cuniculi DSM 21768]|uniref:DUF596 domain-containing protein n=1 Tax=Moraxella cuniculi DSM 21768 TaxID=1122245 RepID=A0A1N7FYP3_9GAMM|nr:DUF596 domain-containing protein [Moraxella cuniculi]SIS05439.1 hypothetical protein SAMN02745664_1203 [Moraxella cuniculi DSM 21768]
MTDVKSQYLARLEQDIESLFDYDPDRRVFMGMFGQHLGALYLTVDDFSEIFEHKVEAFFMLFYAMLQRGHLKLQKDGQILEKSPKEWISIFTESFPKTDMPYGAYQGDIILWFSDDHCPAYAVWVDPIDGSLQWAS